VTSEHDLHTGREGVVSRVFWREEEPWVRVRGRDGISVAVPWTSTDLPQLPKTVATNPPCLSPRALMDLVHHFTRRGSALSPASNTRCSR
jgi:hypothetical protein